MAERLKQLILLLRAHLMDASIGAEFPLLTLEEWNELYSLAISHGVAGFAYEGAYRSGIEIPSSLKDAWQRKMIHDVQHYYSIKRECLRVLSILQENNIKPVILKGFSASHTYPYPELRVMSDMDILVPERFYEAALAIESFGYLARKEVAVHHVEFSKENYLLELHRIPFTPIGSKNYDQLIEAVAFTGEKCEYLNINGFDVPVLCEEDFIHESFEHVLKHLIHDRMALRNICDILMLFVSRNGKNWQKHYDLLVTCDMDDLFSGIVSFLVYEFGLPLEAVEGIDLLSRDQAEEFGANVFSVANVYKGTNHYYSTLTLSGAFLMLRHYLKALSRDLLIKYPYCRKSKLLRPFALIHAYGDYGIELIKKLAGWRRGGG